MTDRASSRDFNTAYTGPGNSQAADASQATTIDSDDDSIMGTSTSNGHSSASVQTSVPQDRFLGKKFFEFVLSETVLVTTMPNAASHQLEAKLARIIDTFPYQEGLDRMHALSPSLALPTDLEDPEGQYSAFLAALGALTRQGDENIKQKMAVAIRNCVSPDAAGSRTQQKTPVNRQAPLPRQNFFHAPRSLFDDGMTFEPFTPPIQDIEIARTRQQQRSDSINYVGKLTSYAQSQPNNVENEWDFRTLDNGDHIAQVRPVGTNKHFHGSAKKKMDAKQMAAERACHYLRL